jgi:hypothetical protein
MIRIAREEIMKSTLIFFGVLLACQAAWAAELFGTVDAVSGSNSVVDQAGQTSAIQTGQKIYEGQTITTASGGEVHIVSEDGGIIAIRPDSVFRVDEYKADGGSSDKVFMSLLKGAMRSITGWIGKHNPSGYLVTTPSATIGVRGTDHETTVIEGSHGDEPGTYDTVTEGATVLKTPRGETEVAPGKFAFAPKDRARAPFVLTRQPNFWARRSLRMEGRLEPRKAFLRSRLENMRETRINRREGRPERHGLREESFDQRPMLHRENQRRMLRREEAQRNTPARQRRHRETAQRRAE